MPENNHCISLCDNSQTAVPGSGSWIDLSLTGNKVAIDRPKLPSMAKHRNAYLAPASPSLARRSSGKRMRFLFPLRPKAPPIKVNTFKLIAGPISKYK